MKKTLILLTAILYGFLVQAQKVDYTFSKVISESNEAIIQGFDITNTLDSGYLIVGNMNWDTGIIVKTSWTGNPVWNKSINVLNYENQHGRVRFNKGIATSDSSFMAVGEAYIPQNDRIQGFAVKINKLGDTIWTKSYYFPETENKSSLKLTGVCEISENDYIIIGNVSQYPEQPYDRTFIGKIDNGGNLQWSFIIAPEAENYAYALERTQDNNAIIGGGVLTNFGWRYYLLKLSPDGEIIWTKTYFKHNTNSGCKILDIIVKEEGFTLLSYMYEHGFSIIRTNNDGEIIWNKNFSGYFSWENIPSMIKTSDNGYAFTHGPSWYPGGCITKTDSVGNEIFTNGLFMRPTNIIESKKHSCLLILGNGPVIGSKDRPRYEIGLIQIDSLGNGKDCVWPESIESVDFELYTAIHTFPVAWGGISSEVQSGIYSEPLTIRNGCVDFSGSISNPDLSENIKVFPNPSDGNFTIETETPTTKEFVLRNYLGQIVCKREIYQTKNAISISLPNGIYFYSVSDKQDILKTGKMLIVR